MKRSSTRSARVKLVEPDPVKAVAATEGRPGTTVTGQPEEKRPRRSKRLSAVSEEPRAFFNLSTITDVDSAPAVPEPDEPLDAGPPPLVDYDLDSSSIDSDDLYDFCYLLKERFARALKLSPADERPPTKLVRKWLTAVIECDANLAMRLAELDDLDLTTLGSDTVTADIFRRLLRESMFTSNFYDGDDRTCMVMYIWTAFWEPYIYALGVCNEQFSERRRAIPKHKIDSKCIPSRQVFDYIRYRMTIRDFVPLM